MSLASRLRHDIAILRSTKTGEDDNGNALLTWAVHATVRAWIQPQTRRQTSVREFADPSGGGTVVSDHTIFLLPTDVTTADVIRPDPDDGRLFHVLAVRDAGGKDHHHELAARLVS